MRIHAGVSTDQTIHASDVDGDPLTFSVNAGPSYMTVTTTDPGSGFATGNIHMAPSLLDAGATTGIVAVYDGVNYRTATFGIAVFPTLERVADMTVVEGATTDQTVIASDSDGYTLSFSLSYGPPFATVTATSDSTGVIHLAPRQTDAGFYPATLLVTDGVASRQDNFFIRVDGVNVPPVLTQPADMHVSAGTYTDQTLTASDADLQSLTFSAVSGHYMFVRTTSGNPARGLVTFNTPLGDSESFLATVAASDGILKDEKSFTVRIDGQNKAPVIHSTPIELAEGADLDLRLVATDTDGQVMVATVSDLAPFMTLGSPLQERGSDTLTIPIRLLPDYVSAGVYHPVVRVTDFLATTTDTLDITIREAGVSETSLRLDRSFSDVAVEREYSVLDGSFGVTSNTFTFLSTSGSGAGWTVRFPWAEGDYEFDGTSSRGTGIIGQDTTGVDLGDCFTYPQIYHVRRVTHRLDGSISSLWATFQMGCGLSGELRYIVQDIPIVLTAPHWLPANTNRRLFFTVSAADTAKDVVAISAFDLPAGAVFLDLGGGSGNFVWTPTRLQFGDFRLRFTATSAGGLADTAFTTIHVSSADLPPVAQCGGPYSGTAGAPLPFTSSGSGDPDGDPITYRWTFGDGGTATEPAPRHIYARPGPYPVSLVVSDGILAGGDQTLATIQEPDSSTAFQVRAAPTSDHAIQLEAGGGHFCAAVQVEPSSVNVGNIDPTSVRMQVKGLGTTDAISADPGFEVGDANHDGLPDATLCFSSETLRALFSKVVGSIHVVATIQFSLMDGHGFRASLPVDVVGPDGILRPLLAPNPLRPSGVFSFVTTVEGAARLTLFDSHGRRVRTLLDVSGMPTGYHDVPIDTHDQNGRALPSGIYFYRLETKEGTRTGRLTLLR